MPDTESGVTPWPVCGSLSMTHALAALRGVDAPMSVSTTVSQSAPVAARERFGPDVSLMLPY